MALYVDSLVSEGLVDLKQLRSQVNPVTVSASTQTMVVGDMRIQYYSGSTTGQIVKLPDATTLTVGYEYKLIQEASVNITVQDNAGGALSLLTPGQRLTATCMGVGSAAGTWSIEVTEKAPHGEQFKFTYPGTGLAVNYTGGNYRLNGTLTAVASGTITLPGSTTGTIYVGTNGAVAATTSIPDGAMPLYSFVTTTVVTSLVDVREEFENNLIWGVLGDISSPSVAKTAGTLEKYARADHSHGSGYLTHKAGVIAAGSFTGSPRTASVTFSTPFASTSYAITITGIDNRSWTYSSKATTGFTINSNANQALTGNVDWEAILVGEST